MQVAITLGKQNRFLLRSAARCFLHIGEPDRAVSLLKTSTWRILKSTLDVNLGYQMDAVNSGYTQMMNIATDLHPTSPEECLYRTGRGLTHQTNIWKIDSFSIHHYMFTICIISVGRTLRNYLLSYLSLAVLLY